MNNYTTQTQTAAQVSSRCEGEFSIFGGEMVSINRLMHFRLRINRLIVSEPINRLNCSETDRKFTISNSEALERWWTFHVIEIVAALKLPKYLRILRPCVLIATLGLGTSRIRTMPLKWIFNTVESEMWIVVGLYLVVEYEPKRVKTLHDIDRFSP